MDYVIVGECDTWLFASLADAERTLPYLIEVAIRAGEERMPRIFRAIA